MSNKFKCSCGFWQTFAETQSRVELGKILSVNGEPISAILSAGIEEGQTTAAERARVLAFMEVLKNDCELFVFVALAGGTPLLNCNLNGT
jgi:hypothetical protein